MEIDPKMLESLICPISQGPLEFDRETMTLVSRKARLVYPIRDGVPIMLESEAQPLEDERP